MQIVNSKDNISTEIFKDKNVPAFIRDHSLFKTPKKIGKIFPSIGLKNFNEPCQSLKMNFDMKRENMIFVTNLINAIKLNVSAAKDALEERANEFQFLETREVREANRDKIQNIFSLAKVCDAFFVYLHQATINQTNLNNTVKIEDGKIALRLSSDIRVMDKVVFKASQSLFGVYSKLRKKVKDMEVDMIDLDQLPEAKIFAAENIPNRSYKIVFSSEGKEGAWDILTMSMRGIRSCQRWDGEYPKCLIGSIFSKFVGIMYLTSGSDHLVEKVSYGSKMMRRSVVRYAIDSESEKPVLILDRMYPDLDKDVLNAFVNTLKSKTSLEVYYSPDISASKLKNLYIPEETIRSSLSPREWSYQDTPLKSKIDIMQQILVNRKGDFEKEINAFRYNLGVGLARKLEDAYNGSIFTDGALKKAIHSIAIQTSFIQFSNSTCIHIKDHPFNDSEFVSGKTYYRKFLMNNVLHKKQITSQSQKGLYSAFVLCKNDEEKSALFSFVMNFYVEFCKKELKGLIA